MALTPKEALNAAKDIATNAVEKASDITEHASDIIRGDIAGGTGGIVQSSLDIANHAVDRTREVFSGGDAYDEHEV